MMSPLDTALWYAHDRYVLSLQTACRMPCPSRVSRFAQAELVDAVVGLHALQLGAGGRRERLQELLMRERD